MIPMDANMAGNSGETRVDGRSTDSVNGGCGTNACRVPASRRASQSLETRGPAVPSDVDIHAHVPSESTVAGCPAGPSSGRTRGDLTRHRRCEAQPTRLPASPNRFSRRPAWINTRSRPSFSPPPRDRFPARHTDCPRCPALPFEIDRDQVALQRSDNTPGASAPDPAARNPSPRFPG